MSSAQSPSSADNAPSDPRQGRAEGCGRCQDAADELAQEHARLLKELREMGAELARVVFGQAMAQAAVERAAGGEPVAAGQQSAAGLSLVYGRVMRAVRQTVALEIRLASGDRGSAVSSEQERRQRHKMRIKRAVKRVIAGEGAGPFKTADWLDELHGRIEDLDDTDFADRPIGEIVAGICRDLGIAFDRRRWEAESQASAGPDGSLGSVGDAPAAEGGLERAVANARSASRASVAANTARHNGVGARHKAGHDGGGVSRSADAAEAEPGSPGSSPAGARKRTDSS
jgi:hypothetical protein